MQSNTRDRLADFHLVGELRFQGESKNLLKNASECMKEGNGP